MTAMLTDTLIPMDLFCDHAPVRIDLVYANPVHARNIFARAIYHPQARLWLHEDLAKITLHAARHLHAQHGWLLVLKDGLRTVEAQAIMQDTDIVKANPHWSAAPPDKRLLSTPGNGAHPRAMAIDVGVVDKDGKDVDMGTPFDFFTSDPAHNPAARDYMNFPEKILEHRRALETAFTGAGTALGLPVVPLKSEWWDFRFPAEIYNAHKGLADADLPPWMQMTGGLNPIAPPEIEDGFDKRAAELLNALDGPLSIAS